MALSLSFTIDAVEHSPGEWTGRVSIDGHVLLSCEGLASEHEAMLAARAELHQHLSTVFPQRLDGEHVEQEYVTTLIELDAAIIIRGAAGWSFGMARTIEGGYLATFTKER